MKRTDTKKIILCGLLAAIDVLLTRVLAINTPVMKIGFGFFAIAVCGFLYGPVWAAGCGALGDVIGSLLFPTGAYFPGFTVTAAVTGIIFGLLLRPYSRKKAAAAAVINVLLVTYLANTFLISFLTEAPFVKLLETRSVEIAVMLPLQCVMLLAVLPVVCRRIKKNS